jgi:hypothetical protein
MMTSSTGSSFSPFLIGAEDDARAADGELEAFAAHGLDQDAELQLAAAGDFEGIGFVADRVTLMATLPSASRSRRSRMTRRLHLVAFLAGERAVVDAEGHGQRRRVDRLGVDRLGHLGIADGVGDGRGGQTRDGDDVARLSFIDRHALEAAEGQHLGDAALLDNRAVGDSAFTAWLALTEPERMRPVRTRPRNGLASMRGHQHAEGAFLDPADCNATMRSNSGAMLSLAAGPGYRTSSPAWRSRR